MSKRQRRRMTERRSVHMQHSRRRTVLPLAVAAVAAPAVAAPAAQASPHVVRLNGSVLNGLAFHRIDAMARAERGLRRDNTSAAKAIANATQTGLFRRRPGRPRRPVAPAKPVALSPTVMAPAPTPVEIQVAPTPAATPVQASGTTAPASGTTAPATASTPAPAATPAPASTATRLRPPRPHPRHGTDDPGRTCRRACRQCDRADPRAGARHRGSRNPRRLGGARYSGRHRGPGNP